MKQNANAKITVSINLFHSNNSSENIIGQKTNAFFSQLFILISLK